MSDTIRDETAERGVLGVLIQRPRLVDRVRQLRADMFVNPAHQAIFTGVVAAADLSGVTADQHVVLERIITAGAVDRSRGAPYLAELINEAPSAGNLAYFAAHLVTAAHRREALLLAEQLAKVARSDSDDEPFREQVAKLTVALSQMAEATPYDERPRPVGLHRLGEFVDEADPADDWIVPDLLARMDRVMVVAEEGIGKSMLARLVAVAVASGRHPFNPNRRITPHRVLIVDLENPPPLIRRKTRPIVATMRAFGAYVEDGAWIWARPGGINLRRPSDVNMLDQICDEVRPALVCFGPLYKAFLPGGDGWEQAAGEVAAALDRIRDRHRCALWLEHHAPMQQAGRRDMRPFGSGVWGRWLEFGLTLQLGADKDPRTVTLGRFKYDRDERDWPDQLVHGDSVPWLGRWAAGMPPSVRDGAA